MFCRFCGKTLNQNDKFCKYCGKEIVKNSRPIDYENMYIGKSLSEFPSDKINIFPFIFGPFYLFYRKMYLYAAIWMLLFLMVFLFTNSLIAFTFSIILGVYFSFQFNFLYRKKVTEDIEEIKEKNDISKCGKLCKTKGGTSVSAILISLAIFFIIIFSISIWRSTKTDTTYNNSSISYGEY